MTNTIDFPKAARILRISPTTKMLHHSLVDRITSLADGIPTGLYFSSVAFRDARIQLLTEAQVSLLQRLTAYEYLRLMVEFANDMKLPDSAARWHITVSAAATWLTDKLATMIYQPYELPEDAGIFAQRLLDRISWASCTVSHERYAIIQDAINFDTKHSHPRKQSNPVIVPTVEFSVCPLVAGDCAIVRTSQGQPRSVANWVWNGTWNKKPALRIVELFRLSGMVFFSSIYCDAERTILSIYAPMFDDLLPVV